MMFIRVDFPGPILSDNRMDLTPVQRHRYGPERLHRTEGFRNGACLKNGNRG